MRSSHEEACLLFFNWLAIVLNVHVLAASYRFRGAQGGFSLPWPTVRWHNVPSCRGHPRSRRRPGRVFVSVCFSGCSSVLPDSLTGATQQREEDIQGHVAALEASRSV